MRSLRFLPLAFFAGVHGFAIFAPYVAIMLAGAHLIRRRQRRILAARAALVGPAVV